MPNELKTFLAGLLDRSEEENKEFTDKVKRSMIRGGLAKIKLAAKIRREISLIYKQYNLYTRIAAACLRNQVKHFDIRKAVDAIHYFGGGWPTKNSKGRMEGLLDAMAGMYKVLDFIGEGEMVQTHLAKHGIIIKILKKDRLKDAKIDKMVQEHLVVKHGLEPAESASDLMRQVIFRCNDLQTLICKEADRVRDRIRPGAMNEMDIDVPEFDRLTNVMRMKMGGDRTQEKIKDKVSTVETSMENFQLGIKEIRIPEKKETDPK